MKRNFVFVGVIFALSAFLIGLMSLTHNVANAQNAAKSSVPKASTANESKVKQQTVKVPENVEDLKIPGWWTNPSKFANHIIFGRGVAIFHNLSDMQNAKNLAETNARYSIITKLGTRINLHYDGNKKKIYESGNFTVNGMREFKSEIVKVDGCFAYYTLFIYSYYNHSLRVFDKSYSTTFNFDFFQPIKKLVENLQSHGVFDPTNLEYDKPIELPQEPEKPKESETQPNESADTPEKE